MGSGIAKQSLEKSGYDVLLGEATIEEARQDAKAGGYQVLPANRNLAAPSWSWSTSWRARRG